MSKMVAGHLSKNVQLALCGIAVPYVLNRAAGIIDSAILPLVTEVLISSGSKQFLDLETWMLVHGKRANGWITRDKTDKGWDLDEDQLAVIFNAEDRNLQSRYVPYWYIPHSMKWVYHRGYFYSIERTNDINSATALPIESLHIRAFSLLAIKDLQTEASTLRKATEANALKIYTPLTRKERLSNRNPWGPPQCRPLLPVGTLALSASVREVFTDAKEFVKLKTMQYYRDNGITYKRNYLFNGPPGTGKTSTSLAVAGELERPVYRINLSDSNLADEDLPRLLDSTCENCIIIFDEADQAQFTQVDTIEENARKGGISVSGLRMALDGTGQGKIITMMCNDRQLFDSTTLRAGRIDKEYEFELLTPEMAIAMVRRLLKEEIDGCPNAEAQLEALGSKLEGEKLCPAEFERHIVNKGKLSKVLDCLDELK